MKTKKPKVGRVVPIHPRPLPAKDEERARDMPPDAAVEAMDKEPPPELAKTFSAGEAQRIVEQRLRPIAVGRIETVIEGDDLITHAWSAKALKQMLSAQQMSQDEKRLAKMNREAKDPKADYEGARYHWDGKDWFPANGIKKAMVSAGFALGIPRSIIQRSVFVVGDQRRDYVEIKYARIVMREDAVQVGPPKRRTADLRYRPEYQGWSARLIITFRSDVLKQERVLTLLEHAGFSVGIGEWRPERSGQAGTFQIARSAKQVRNAR